MTTKVDIERWIERGSRESARWMVVICDGFDHSDFPVFFKENERDLCKKKILSARQGENMERLMEVYDFLLPLEQQLNERRAMHEPKD